MEKARTATKSLTQIIRESFLGPFALRAVAAGGKTPVADAIKFVPVNEDDFMTKMGLDEPVRIFPVAAFKPKLGKTYNCLCRLRPNARIMEALPLGHDTMSGREWLPEPVVANFAVEFHRDERTGNFWGKHPKAGQAILPHKEWEMPAPDKDGVIIAPTGTIELRPTCTRTFYVAGPVGSLAVEKVSHFALDVYEGNGEDKPDYSYAPQFRLFGRWWTAFQVVGNPFQGLFEADSFTMKEIRLQATSACEQLEKWAVRELLPILHPDFITTKNFSGATQVRILEVADETRVNLMALTEWFSGWVDTVLQDLTRRKAAGKPLTVKVPAPVGTVKKHPRLLVEEDRASLEGMLYPKQRKSPSTRPAATKRASTTTDAPVNTKPAAVIKTTTKVAKKPATKVAPRVEVATRTAASSSEEEVPITIANGNVKGADKLAALKELLENGDSPKPKRTRKSTKAVESADTGEPTPTTKAKAASAKAKTTKTASKP